MNELPKAIPDFAVLLALEPEELAVKMLILLRQRGGMVILNNLEHELWEDPARGIRGYPRARQNEIMLAL